MSSPERIVLGAVRQPSRSSFLNITAHSTQKRALLARSCLIIQVVSASPVMPAVPANVTADWTEDAVSHWDTAPAEAEDGAAGIRIRTDAAVTEVRLAALTTEINGDGTASYTLGETLYAAASLTPEEELVAETAFMGMLPDRCLCYRDTDGTERCFALAISGKDGSLMMMDITGEVH